MFESVRCTIPAKGQINLDFGVKAASKTLRSATAGSGTITAGALAPDAEVTVAGSGQIETGSVSGSKLEVTLPGSGSFRAAGAVGTLDLTILGSGTAQLDALKAEGATRILVLSAYPQYSATTTASVIDAVNTWVTRARQVPELRFVNRYHDDAGYIEALARTIEQH